MKRQGFVEVELSLRDDVTTSFSHSLEVSLDCPTCQRRRRTIVFDGCGKPGKCTPTRHEFRGVLKSAVFEEGYARFEFDYEFSDFIDIKYPDEEQERYALFEKGAPSWARVYFDINCPACGRTTTTSTQTNLVRPWTCACECEQPVYDDLKPPRLGWKPA